MTFGMNKGNTKAMNVKRFFGFILLAVLLLAAFPAVARDDSGSAGSLQRYIIELQDPPLASYRGQKLSATAQNGLERLQATAAKATGRGRLDLRSAEAREYLEFIATRHSEFSQDASLELGRTISPVYRYRVATNGMAIDISAAEAAILAKSPLVKSVEPDKRYRLHTFAGPRWIGAGELWTGDAGFPPARGEGVIVGSIDSGVNWDHPSFDNPTLDGYTHTNPLGGALGLCNDLESGAQCNGKLIGVYDFVEDDPGTEDVVEEYTNGKDNDGHGSHTASIAAGNRINTFAAGLNVTVSGVADRANIISYRVCYIGEPVGPDSGGCMGSAILSAIDQAVTDGVDVINYSIGSDASDPWREGSIAAAFLNVRDSGIFVATSAGNSGPGAGTVGSPANAPWIVAVGAATHNVGFGSILQNLTGGATTPPGDLVGASLTNGITQRTIVHARDFGFALCGTGEAELEASCDDNEGLSNPWDGQKPFNGEIVVCDRGTYGRVEKGKNVLLAGAGGYILANTDEQGEAITADDHCLPATHIGDEEGNKLRDWLASGSGHSGSISGNTQVESDGFADQVTSFSSRGPALPPVADTLKPNVIAPGYQIWAADYQGQSFSPLNGTSFSSPHVAGAAALLKSVHPDWSVSQLVSAIETTSTADLATDQSVAVATPQQRGAGRPQLGEAANAGLFLDVTTAQFLTADPGKGGQPRELNLPGLVDSRCQGFCTFSRTVTDQMGGGVWNAVPVGFPAGVSVTITPANFALGNGASQNLKIDVDIEGSGIVSDWVSGTIQLTAAGSSDQFLTVSVFPDGWTLTDNRNGGWQEFNLSKPLAMPDATFTAGGLVKPSQTVKNLVQDPTDDSPYDGEEGVFTVWHSLPQGGLWLHAETLASTAEDLDLFVGRDVNGNGIAEESEELCSSTTPQDLEECNLYDLTAGDYWILVQNWLATQPAGDNVTLVHAAIAPSADSRFAASGPGMVGANQVVPVRLSWDNLDALPGEQVLGAVGVGSNRAAPYNMGVIPVRFNRNGISDAETFPLVDGETHRLALDANDSHDRLFIDVPPGANKLTVYSSGANSAQNNGLTLELKRLDFDSALNEAPFATPASVQPTLVSASGVGGVGPSITVVGVQAGRWYAVLTNTNGFASAVTVRADVEFQGEAIQPHLGLWSPSSRPNLAQGYEFNQGGQSRALIWYTYDEDGQPAWYLAANPVGTGNIWTADLLRFTNDGAQQHSVPVGRVAISVLNENDAMFSYTLFGRSGTERMWPLALQTCPQINGSERSYTGLWSREVSGLGGASVLVNNQTQSQIHYLYDGSGAPRWLLAQDLANPEPTNSEVPILQFSGYCAVCQVSNISSQTAGVLERSFESETAGGWTLDYLFAAPLSGSVDRTDGVVKVTDVLGCQ